MTIENFSCISDLVIRMNNVWKDRVARDFPLYYAPTLPMTYAKYYQIMHLVHNLRDKEDLLVQQINVSKCEAEINKAWTNRVPLLYPVPPFTIYNDAVWADIEISRVCGNEDKVLISMRSRESALGLIPVLGLIPTPGNGLTSITLDVLPENIRELYQSKIDLNNHCSGLSQHLIISQVEVDRFLQQAKDAGYIHFGNICGDPFVGVDADVANDPDFGRCFVRSE